MSKKYEAAGVSLNAGYESVDRIKKHVERTRRLGMLGGIGSFGGLFDLTKLNYKEPILVSGTDGVGTKLLISQALNKHDTIGVDAVAMCVNDVLTNGAEPLFFLDYLAIGKNTPSVIEDLVKGVSDGCIQSNCALIGGETAEMPDMYDEDEYDVAGFAVGIVEKSKMIDGSKVEVGDVIIGLPSSGVHSNGFSLVRKIIFKDNNLPLSTPFENSTLGEVLLTPTIIYAKPVLALLKEVDVLAIAHITGGGFDENIPRVLKEHQGVTIHLDSFPKLPIFKFLEEKGNISNREMYQIFNMGIGMMLVVKKDDVAKTIEVLAKNNQKAYQIGYITDQPGVNLV